MFQGSANVGQNRWNRRRDQLRRGRTWTSTSTSLNLNLSLSVAAATNPKSGREVDEKGTTAAAATAAVMVELSCCPQQVKVDKPFLFLIRDRGTGAILFTGWVTDPRA